jgi:hypothetical protein
LYQADVLCSYGAYSAVSERVVSVSCNSWYTPNGNACKLSTINWIHRLSQWTTTHAWGLAVSLCRNISWWGRYLPNRDQLVALYNAWWKEKLGLQASSYWSSTEIKAGNIQARYVSMVNGSIKNSKRTKKLYVVCAHN